MKIHPSGSLVMTAWLCLLGLSSAGALPPERAGLPDIDRRAGKAAVAAAGGRQAAVAALRAQVAGAQIEFNEVVGGLKWVRSRDGYLSGPGGEGKGISAAVAAGYATDDPHRAAKAFVQEHQALFGYGPEALASARIYRDYVTPHNGMQTTWWQQELEGIEVYEAVFAAHTTKAGELIGISSQFLADPAAAANAGATGSASRSQPVIPAQQAVVAAAGSLEEPVELAGVKAMGAGATGAEQRQQFTAKPFNQAIEARLVWLPMNPKQMRLCWEVTLTSHARGQTFRVLVDAQTGEVQVRRCLTVDLSDASYRVYTSDSPSPFSPGWSTPNSGQPPLTSRVLVTWSALDTNASPNGWIDDGVNETRGNNVDAHTDRDANDVPDLPRPQGSPYRVFDCPMDLTQSPSTYTNAAVVQMFYWCNFMHDKLYELGFTEAAGNFQNNNFGRGGLGNDALQADAQDGSGYNNANFTPTPDGTPPRIQMYIFNGPTPNRDGDFDAEVLLHEYTHGLSSRLVGGGVGISALQTEGMGEGWSDWYALAVLSEAGDDVNGVYACGGYVTYMLSGMTQNYYFGIRRYPYCTDMTKNPLTFKDIDPAQASSHSGIPRSPIIGNEADEVHNMGEVWCMTLREARANLINKYGWAVGNPLILQLVTDGMKLSPANPNFLQARDAILQADQVDNGGANQHELWAAFAKRGMGYSATSPSSSTTTGLHEAYDIPFQPLQLTVPVSATEGDGVLAGAGQVRLPYPVGTNVVIALSSSDTSEATVPPTVTILAGQTNRTFDLTIIDDGVLDGTQTSTITASASGFANGYGTISVFDNETATLRAALPATAVEGQGTVQGTVQVSAVPAANIVVSLSSSDTTEIQVPASVTIPVGQTSAVFTATVVDDNQIDGPQPATVTAHVQNWTDGSATITVLDNESRNLTVTLPASAWENAGVLTNAGSVSISGTLPTDLVVSLMSGTPAKLTVPSSVTIPAGQVSTAFNLTLVDNSIPDGHQTVTVTASAPLFTNGTASIYVIDDESPPPPSNPRPGNLAVNVPANTNLMWDNGTSSELVLNGGFETGTLTNWTQVPSTYGQFVINDGTLDPPSPDGPLPPYAGSYSALAEQTGAGVHYMYQDVSIPSGTSLATLSWAHRVRNFYSSFNTSQQFQVQLCDTNNNVLAVAFTTNPGDPLLGDWVQKSYDLTPFAGQKLRVRFWVNPSMYYLDVHVDNVSVQVASTASGITNDVYFGTNPTPGPAEFQGSTTGSSWTLPLLAPLTTYYWQIIVHKGGTATGPVWQFTTAGVDHFAWNPISSPQFVNQPFGATITAKDAFNTTVSNFTGRVGLSAGNGSSGLGQLVTFDDLSGSGLPVPAGYGGLTWNNFSYLLGADHPGSGYLAGTVSPPNAAFNPYGNPASITSTGQVNFVSAYLTAAWNDNLQVQVKGYAGATLVYSNSYTLSATAPTLINFNYLGVNEVDFISSGGTPHPGYAGSGTHFVMDNIVIGGSAASPVSITPTNSGNFVNGAWTGNITVLQPATNVVLQADDGSGHTGFSNPFDVNVTNDLSISIMDSPDPVSVGASLTYTLKVANTGPSAATGVMVTNLLPAGVTFMSATASQGTCSQSAGVVTCNLGTIFGGNNATIIIVVVPTTAGTTITNLATVSRAEVDPYPGNNLATATTVVNSPAISIADASVVEGNVGTTSLVFAVTLAAPSAQTITVNYATTDGSATAGSDYYATNGILTFPPGTTNQNLTVTVIGDTTIETDETLYVDLSSPLNGTLGRSQGVGTIVNDDGLPGQVDHFELSSVASPQFVNVPFPLTVAAKDAFNNIVSSFTGTVSLYGVTTNRVGANLDFEAGTLAPWTPLNTGNQPGPYELVTFDVNGDGISSTAFRIAANSGIPDGITQNVPLTGGITYTVKMDIATDNSIGGNNADGGTTAILIGGTTVAQFGWGDVSAGNIYRTNLTGTFTPPSNGVFAVTLTFYRDYYEPGNLWCLADDLSIVGPGGPVPILPTVTGNFTNGIWSGNVTVLNRATNAVLVADDGNGHNGLSNPFDVEPFNMPPVVLAQPVNQTNFVHSSAVFAVTADGTPPLTYQWNFNGTNLPGATNASLTLTNLQYTQAGNYAVLVTNAYGFISSSNATLMVMSHPPVAMPDTVAFLVGTPQVSFNVLSNDYDVDDDPLTVQSFTSPARGALAQINNGQFTYQPNPNFTSGQDQFTYTITDGHGGTANAQVTINAYNRYLDSGDWPTFGNGPSHTGYYPGVLGGATLVAGWSTNLGGPLNQVAVGGGNVYVTQIGYPDGQYLTALNAVSGQAVWQFNFASAFSINPPTYDHGRVYVQRGNSSDSQLWCINAGDGSAVWSAPFGAQWESYYAPTVYGDGIWVDGGVYGGMYGFSTNGTQRFFNSGLEQYDQWTPTYYQGTVYSWVAGNFRAHDPVTGTVLWMASFGWNWDGWSMNTVSAIDGGRAFVQQRPNLIAIDLTTHTNVWTATGGVKGSPAVANGIVFAIMGDGVQAFSAQDGTSLGVYEATNDTGVAWQPIVTDDALFISSPSATYVFNLASHQLIQTIPYGGTLSLANGRLYIAGQDGWLRVYSTPNVGPAVLTVTPSTGLAASGPVGGPFNPSNMVYTLSNSGTNALDWSASCSQAWVPVLTNTSPDAVRVITINSSQNHQFFRAVASTGVVPPVLSAASYAAGQFQFTLSGQADATYIIEALTDLQAQAGWVTVDPPGGSLAPGASTNVNVLINASACSLGSGVYAATVAFHNLTSGAVQGRPVSLTVQMLAPNIITQPTNQTVIVGGTANFNVTANGMPPLSYQWRFNGTNIVGATGTNLTLTNVQLNQAGNYTVLVTNAYGSILSSNAVLTVNLPPPVPVIIGFSPISGFVGISVTISGTNFSPVLSNNIVYFGAVRAVVTAASVTNLVVTVPVGATYAPITETVGGLVAYARTAFEPTFLGDGSNISPSSFAPRVDLAGGSGSYLTVIADLDGDGKPDLVVANGYDNNISLFRNISTNGPLTINSFAPRVDLPSIGGGVGGLTVADVDGDGKLDLVVSDYSDNQILVYRNISTVGTLTADSFAAPVAFNVGNYPMAGRVRDLDGDGRPDIVCVNNGDNTISILKNIGTAGSLTTNSFAPQVTLATGNSPHDLVIADLDGDGKPDLAQVNYTPSFLSVFRNVSVQGVIDTNSFAARVDFAAAGEGDSIIAGDVDGDGKVDLVAGWAGGSAIAVYRNLSNPGLLDTNSFAPEVDFPVPGWTRSVGLGDLNGDGKPDIGLTCEVDSYMCIYQNLSTPGSFTNASLAGRVDYGAGWNPHGMAIGDLDGDGRPDIIFGNTYDSTISIYQNVVPFGTNSALDHFAWNPIPSPRFVNTPFAVTIRAQNPTNGISTNFTGTAILGTTNGVAVTPSVSGNFVQGVWTGAVVISQTASNLVLQADDGFGHFGLANPINVVSLPSLGMLHSGNIAVYMWPVEYPGFVLETSGSLLAPIAWTVVPYSPVQVGDQYLLPLHMTGTNGYFRLWFPGP